MKKRRNKPYRPRPHGWDAIQITLMGASTERQHDDVHLWLATRAYASIDKLTAGTFTRADFVAVSNLNAFAYVLAVEICPGLDADSRAAVIEQKDVIEQAANALTSIGERYGRTDKFGASGPELAVIRQSLSLMDALTSYANVGETVRAMKNASQMTMQAMRDSECT